MKIDEAQLFSGDVQLHTEWIQISRVRGDRRHKMPDASSCSTRTLVKRKALPRDLESSLGTASLWIFEGAFELLAIDAKRHDRFRPLSIQLFDLHLRMRSMKPIGVSSSESQHWSFTAIAATDVEVMRMVGVKLRHYGLEVEDARVAFFVEDLKPAVTRASVSDVHAIS